MKKLTRVVENILAENGTLGYVSRNKLLLVKYFFVKYSKYASASFIKHWVKVFKNGPSKICGR